MGRSLQGTHHTELLGGCRRRCPRHRLAPAGHPYGTPSSATGLAASRIIRRADRLLNRSEWWLTSRFVIPWCPLLSPRFRRVAAPRPTPRLCAALSDYAAFPIHTRTFVRYAGPAGTWHDLDVGRPIAALERCAELLGVDLAPSASWPPRSSRTSAPTAPGSGASCSSSGSSGPRRTAYAAAATSTADGPQPPTHKNRNCPVCGTVARARATASLSGFCTRTRFCRIAPTTSMNDVPLETVTDRSVPMACGPNVDRPQRRTDPAKRVPPARHGLPQSAGHGMVACTW
jgi:hypothetical protein